MHEVYSTIPCTACLDSRECWVCLGAGTIETPQGGRATCAACDRTGECRTCAPIPQQRGA